MFWMLKNKGPVFEAEGVTGATPAAPVAPAAPASVLTYDDAPAGDGTTPPADTTPAAEGEGAPAAEGEGEAPGPLDTVPEDGVYALTMPEGVEVDQELLGALAPQFKELGLTTSQAQALADKFIAAQQSKMEGAQAQFAETVSKWVDDAKKDPEIGGAKWDSTVKNASGVVSRFGSPELKEFLNSSGAGNHPELIRFMAKVGAMIGEDNPAISENPGRAQARDTASILYPDDKPKG